MDAPGWLTDALLKFSLVDLRTPQFFRQAVEALETPLVV
jgi:hypothetical protein